MPPAGLYREVYSSIAMDSLSARIVRLLWFLYWRLKFKTPLLP
jgi:hypothetical protein